MGARSHGAIIGMVGTGQTRCGELPPLFGCVYRPNRASSPCHPQSPSPWQCLALAIILTIILIREAILRQYQRWASTLEGVLTCFVLPGLPFQPGVRLLDGRWQDVIPKLIAAGTTFDGIFFDTYGVQRKGNRLNLLSLVRQELGAGR